MLVSRALAAALQAQTERHRDDPDVALICSTPNHTPMLTFVMMFQAPEAIMG